MSIKVTMKPWAKVWFIFMTLCDSFASFYRKYSNQRYSMLQLTRNNCDNKGEHVTVDQHVCITFMKTTQGFILVTVTGYQNNTLIILDKHQTI